jgi:hypothetical protein
MSESLVGRENPYVCQSCGKLTTTVHVDDGVTPFMLNCRATPGCKGMSYSSFYPKGPRPAHVPPPAWEWYRPADDQPLKDWEADHVAQGGVLLRPAAARRMPICRLYPDNEHDRYMCPGCTQQPPGRR